MLEHDWRVLYEPFHAERAAAHVAELIDEAARPHKGGSEDYPKIAGVHAVAITVLTYLV